MKSFTVKTVVAAVASLALTGVAQAEDTGFYMSLGLGQASVKDVGVTYYDAGGTFGGTGSEDSAEGQIDLKSAFATRGALGYDFGTIRSDVEVDYSRNKVKSLTVNSVNGSPVTLTAADATEVCDYLEIPSCSASGNTISYSGGRVRQLSALANLWVDLPVGSSIVPYAGGGLGVSGFETDGEGKARFAWQLGAGVGFAVSPGFVLSADFRHREAKGADLPWDDVSGTRVSRIKTNTIALSGRVIF
jgi:opacity protein-like surface antigen